MFDRLPIGIDPGADGGIAAIHESQVIFHRLLPPRMLFCLKAETDADQIKWAKSKSKQRGNRYVEDGELKRTKRPAYFKEDMVEALQEAVTLGGMYGYLTGFVMREKTATPVRGGKMQVSSMVAGGRVQNTWDVALHEAGIRSAEIAPNSWKAKLGLSSDKEESIRMASDLFDLPAEVASSHDLCEAVLLAHYLREHCPRYLRMGH